MARGTPSPVLAALAAPGAHLVTLLEITTGGSPSVVRVCSGAMPLTFAGVDFTARGMNPGEVSARDHNETGATSVLLDDSDGWWQTLLEAGASFQGKRVQMYRTESSLVEGSVVADALADVFIINTWTRTHGVVSLSLQPLTAVLEIVLPLGTVSIREFPGVPDSNVALR